MTEIHKDGKLIGKLHIPVGSKDVHVFDKEGNTTSPDKLLDLLSGFVHNFGEKHPIYRKAADYDFTTLLKSAIKFGNTKYRNLNIISPPDSIQDKVFYSKYRGKAYSPRPDENWYDEDWKTVNSSAVKSVAYNPDMHRLYLEFKRSGKVYQYEGVPPKVHDSLLNSASKGKFVYYVLRNHGTDSMYSYRQID